MDTPKSTKLCKGCGEEWPLTSFYWRTSAPDTFRPNCKACMAYPSHTETVRLTLLAGPGWKICTLCKEPKRPTAEFFSPRENGKYLHSHCKACSAAKKKERYAEDPEPQKRAAKESRERNLEQANEKQRERYARDREALLAQKKIHYRDNHSEMLARVRTYREANPELVKARAKAYQAANLDRFRVHGNNRRARERNAPGSYTLKDTRRIAVAQNGRCHYCGIEFGEEFEMDHRTPLSRGGSNWPSNLCAACRSCNARKSNKTEEEFLALIS